MSAEEVYQELAERFADDRTFDEYKRAYPPDEALEQDFKALWRHETDLEIPRLRTPDLDARFELEIARFHVYFADTPLIGGLADTLTLLDRETRRVATALEEGVDPRVLRGRGVHLLRRSEGLHVMGGHPGSLDLVAGLGGLVSVVTGQPVSFALNLSSLIGYGRATIGVLTSKGLRRSRRISVEGGGAKVEAPADAVLLLDAEDKDGSRLRVAYFPDGSAPEELPERLFNNDG